MYVGDGYVELNFRSAHSTLLMSLADLTPTLSWQVNVLKKDLLKDQVEPNESVIPNITRRRSVPG